MHDICEVHPLVAVSVSVLGRVGLRAGYLAHTEPLGVVSTYQHRGFAVASRAGLRAEATCVHGGAASGLGVADAWLHDVDRPAGLVVTLLDVGEEALNFLMAGCSWYVCEIGRVDVLDVGELANRLVNDALLVMSGLRDAVRALAVLYLLLVLLCAG